MGSSEARRETMVNTVEIVKILVRLKATIEKCKESNIFEYIILKNLWWEKSEMYLIATK